jgi:HlyD family secretion protein
MSRTKVIVIVGAVAVGAVAVAFGVRGRGDDRVAVQTAAVGRHQVVQTVTATGKIQPVTQVKISADVSAKIIRLAVKEG